MSKTDFIETDQLRAFEAVARIGSFTEAARALGIPQTTVSHQIARLEGRAGRLLIRRSTRRVELTDAGSAMLVYVRSILGLAEAARRRLMVPPVDGVLKIAIAEEFAATKLAGVLSIFRRQHPRFELRFLTARNDYIFAALEGGEVDIVLGKCRTGLKRGELLWREPLVWVGQPFALEAPTAPVPLLVYLRPSEVRDVAEAALLACHRPCEIVAESANLSGLVAAAQAGLGVLPIGRNFIPSGLSALPPESGLPELGKIDYVIEYRSQATDPAVRSFAGILREFAKQLVQDPVTESPREMADDA
jgi:DNA-binding transcriptional LysR family regulator